MLYLFSKILFCLALAAGLGGVIGWLLRGAGRRGQLAETEAGWRRRLDTTEKERLALAAERDRLVKENASLKSLHSGCRPKIEALESEVEAAHQAQDLHDEEITRLKLNLQVLEDQAEPGGEDQPELPPKPETGKRARFDAKPTKDEAGMANQTASRESEGVRPDDLEGPSLEELETEPAGLLTQPPDVADDLKKIKGIGRVLQRTLNELGIFHFRQLARLSDGETAWVARNLKTFPDRIRRDRWVQQATSLHEKKYGEKP